MSCNKQSNIILQKTNYSIPICGYLKYIGTYSLNKNIIGAWKNQDTLIVKNLNDVLLFNYPQLDRINKKQIIWIGEGDCLQTNFISKSNIFGPDIELRILFCKDTLYSTLVQNNDTLGMKMLIKIK